MGGSERGGIRKNPMATERMDSETVDERHPRWKPVTWADGCCGEGDVRTVATIALAAAGIYNPRPLMPRQIKSGPCTCPECGKAFRGRIARSQHLQDAHGYSKSRSKNRL